jgi:hypothetical protein
MAFKELYNMIENAEKMAQATAKKLDQPEKKYEL